MAILAGYRQALDQLTTGTSRRLSSTAGDLDDLVLWIGRLARAHSWTPARSNITPLRAPAELAPAPADITAVLIAVAHTMDAVTQVTHLDLGAIERAAAAGTIYSPARLLPESADVIHAYRYRPASADQIAELLHASHETITAAHKSIAALDSLLQATSTVGEAHALARALRHNPAGSRPHPGNTWPRTAPALTSTGLSPEAGETERLLHSLQVSDPELLLRAAALDHANRDLTSEAIGVALQRTRANDEAKYSTYSYSRPPRSRSARAAGNDNPDNQFKLSFVATNSGVPLTRGPTRGHRAKRR